MADPLAHAPGERPHRRPIQGHQSPGVFRPWALRPLLDDSGLAVVTASTTVSSPSAGPPRPSMITSIHRGDVAIDSTNQRIRSGVMALTTHDWVGWRERRFPGQSEVTCLSC